MIRIIIACALISLAAAAVIPDDSQAQIINYKNENDGSGNYDFSFETSNGITRQETGRLINAGAEDQYVDVQGSVTFFDADGKLVQLNYRANEDGYQVYPNKETLDVPSQPNFPPVMGGYAYGLPTGVVASLLGK